jgi:hypothetical protein
MTEVEKETLQEGQFMRKKSPRRGSLHDYIAEILKNAEYEKGEQLDVIVIDRIEGTRKTRIR